MGIVLKRDELNGFSLFDAHKYWFLIDLIEWICMINFLFILSYSYFVYLI